MKHSEIRKLSLLKQAKSSKKSGNLQFYDSLIKKSMNSNPNNNFRDHLKNGSQFNISYSSKKSLLGSVNRNNTNKKKNLNASQQKSLFDHINKTKNQRISEEQSFKILEIIPQMPTFGQSQKEIQSQKLEQYIFDANIRSHSEFSKTIQMNDSYQSSANPINIIIVDVCSNSCQFLSKQQIENESLNNIESKVSYLPKLMKYLNVLLLDLETSSDNQASNKYFISIYMQENQSPFRFYDMLSIRREVKQEGKQFVKTYISNTKKSSLILNKLIQFANHRQIVNYQEGINGTIVIRLEIQSQKHKIRRIIELSYERELIKKDTNTIKVYRAYQNCERHLESFKKPTIIVNKNLPQNEKELLSHITNLHKQLECNRKELQQYKEMALNKLEEDLERDMLPSQRVQIDLEKYGNTGNKIAPMKMNTKSAKYKLKNIGKQNIQHLSSQS